MRRKTLVEKLVRSNIAELTPYSTARDEFEDKGEGGEMIFLDANESPYKNGWNRYPDPHQKELKAKVSTIKGMPTDTIFLGNGSDEAIDLVFRVFCNPGKDNVVIISPSYGMYTVCAQINNVEVHEVRLREDFSLPKEDVLAACDKHTKAIFLCSPNNPTGNAFPKEDILYIVENFAGIVVLDEAYADFSSQGSLRREIHRHENLIVLQTFSKAYGLAALRVGMAFAQPEIIELMSRVKYPYNINKASYEAVAHAIIRPITINTARTISQRAFISNYLEKLPICEKVYPSDANFVLAKFTNANAVYRYLLSKGIIVRNRSKVPGCENCLRISVGTQKENIKMLEYLLDYERNTAEKTTDN